MLTFITRYQCLWPSAKGVRKDLALSMKFWKVRIKNSSSLREATNRRRSLFSVLSIFEVTL